MTVKSVSVWWQTDTQKQLFIDRNAKKTQESFVRIMPTVVTICLLQTVSPLAVDNPLFSVLVMTSVLNIRYQTDCRPIGSDLSYSL